MRFPFPDEWSLTHGEQIRRVRTHLSVEPAVLGSLTAAIGRSGALRALTNPTARSYAIRALTALGGRFGDDRIALAALAVGPEGRCRSVAVGRGESSATAVGVAAVLDQIDRVPPGAHWAHDVVDHERFISQLQDLGLDVVQDGPGRGRSTPPEIDRGQAVSRRTNGR